MAEQSLYQKVGNQDPGYHHHLFLLTSAPSHVRTVCFSCATLSHLIFGFQWPQLMRMIIFHWPKDRDYVDSVLSFYLL